jgi:hypothetical protein
MAGVAIHTWQPAQPQQIGQVRRVSLTVLDPPVGEHLHPQLDRSTPELPR